MSVDLNDKTNWLRRLAGESVSMTPDSKPDYGYYRIKRNGSWAPYVYFYNDGKLQCWCWSKALDEQTACELWSYALQNPITYEVYSAVMAGKPWPDLNEVALNLSNNPPDPQSKEGLRDAIDSLYAEAGRLMKAGAAKTKEVADQAAHVADRLSKLWKMTDELRARKKAPALKEAAEIEAEFKPLLARASVYKVLKDIVHTPYLLTEKAEKARKEAEARRLADEKAEEARRAAAELDAMADQAARTGDAAVVADAEAQVAKVKEAEREAAMAAQNAHEIASRTVTAGTLGRGVHLRSIKRGVIDDRRAVVDFFFDSELITEALQKCVDRAVKAGVTVPGVRVETETKAA